MNYEYEQKGLINQQQFYDIIRSNNVIKTTTQINYYLETSDKYFQTNNSALRVRKINDSYQLTLKTSTKNGNTEHNHNIDAQTFSHILLTKHLPEKLQFPIPKLTLATMATIITIRHQIKFEHHLIELDNTIFNQDQDYEIEVEADNLAQAQQIFKKFIAIEQITFKPSKAKIARYYQYNPHGAKEI